MTIEEMKELILWARANKVSHIKFDHVEFTFSDSALFASDSNNLAPGSNQKSDSSTNTEGDSTPEGQPVSGQDDEMDDDTLFHSA